MNINKFMRITVKKIVDFFTVKEKEPLNDIAENMAIHLRLSYSQKERVYILRNMEAKILADIITEKRDFEDKFDECTKAIKQLKSYELFANENYNKV